MTTLTYLIDKLDSDQTPEYLRASQDLLEMGHIAVVALIDVMLNRHDRQGWRAARLLAEAKAPEAVPAFILALASCNPLIRQTAVQALGNQGNCEVVPYLLPHLQTNDYMMQLWIIEVLGKLRDNRAIEPLLDLLQRTESMAIQYGIIKALGAIGDPIAANVLPNFFDSSDRNVQAQSHEVYEQLASVAIAA